MVKYKCKNCNKDFDQKCHWINHTEKRKKLCIPICIEIQKNPEQSPEIQKNPEQSLEIQKNIIQSFNNDIPIQNVLIEVNSDENINIDKSIPTCPYCANTFYQSSNLNKHLRSSCKIKKQQDEQKEDIFKKLLLQESMLKQKDEQIHKLISQNDILIDKICILECKVDKITSSNFKKTSKSIKTINNNNNSTNTNTSNNTTNTTNTTNTNNGVIFNLVTYGKEDLDKIDSKYFINNVVKNNKISGVKIPEEILELIHFNPAYPEHNNIYISDINREKCMVWDADEGMWKLSNDDKIPEVIDKVVKYSYDKQDELREKFPNNKPLIERLNVINKYTQFTDNEYVDGLRGEQEEQEEEENDFSDYSNDIKRCEDFQKKTYDIFKITMYNEGLKIKKSSKKLV